MADTMMMEWRAKAKMQSFGSGPSWSPKKWEQKALLDYCKKDVAMTSALAKGMAMHSALETEMPPLVEGDRVEVLMGEHNGCRATVMKVENEDRRGAAACTVTVDGKGETHRTVRVMLKKLNCLEVLAEEGSV